jgi:hypothetical protein
MRLELHGSSDRARPRSLERRLLDGLAHPLDFLRRRQARGFQIGVRDQDVPRGEEVEALVTISSARGLGDVEVGLVCTEYYACESEGVSSDGSSGGRATTYAIAHEAWLPVESAPGVQSVRLTIPPEAPFSYEGDCLSFKWEVVARGRRSRRLDAQARGEVSVLQ